MQVAVQGNYWALESLKTLGWPNYCDDDEIEQPLICDEVDSV